VATASAAICSSRTEPMKRMPLRGNVLMRRCSSPLSAIAERAALIHVVSADSETIRRPQTDESKSSLLTTRSRFRIINVSKSKTLGSIESKVVPRRNSRRFVSSTKSSNKYNTPEITVARVSPNEVL
jgi:hypothetical protein